MQKEGNLVIYGPGDKPLWSTATAGNPGAYLLLPKESGNLVICSRDNRPLWSSKVSIGKLPSGHVLRAGQSIQSANGRYRLVQRDEGNAVLYDGRRSLFTTPTAGHPGARSIMQAEGNWVVVGRDDKALWTTKTAGNPGRGSRSPTTAGSSSTPRPASPSGPAADPAVSGRGGSCAEAGPVAG
ncbi:hypothetical protein GCM10009733_081960 [Nonomuraea maheshkhaliensis]|uniref:Bulb-type lectin domain-containing protein n=1 Tax=Nonomuraea maheshkhaliensis TaxID=419590 RepID=A0ABN2GJP1_9ACTN